MLVLRSRRLVGGGVNKIKWVLIKYKDREAFKNDDGKVLKEFQSRESANEWMMQHGYKFSK